MHLAGRLVSVVFVIVTVVGCGPGTYPVEGQVVFTDGKAARELSGGAVEFRSLEVQPAVSARGLIRDDGSFSVTTHKPGDGAVAGRHRVLITPPIVLATKSDVPAAGPAGGPLKQLVDPRVTAFETSGLEVVVEKKPTAVTLTVGRPPR